MQWFEAKPPPMQEPQWKWRAAIDDNGTVFAPAGVAGNEQIILLCATQDGIPAVISNRHVYLPTTWLASEYPDFAAVFHIIERRCRDENRRQ